MAQITEEVGGWVQLCRNYQKALGPLCLTLFPSQLAPDFRYLSKHQPVPPTLG